MKQLSIVITIILLILNKSYAQKIELIKEKNRPLQYKYFDIKIDKPNNVNINNSSHIDTQIFNGAQVEGSTKLQLIGYRDIAEYRIVGSDKFVNDSSVSEYTFGNPDSIITRNVDFSLIFENAFDTAFFAKTLTINNGKVDYNVVRDSYVTISPDKKKISYKASYIGAKVYIKLTVIAPIPKSKSEQIWLEGLVKPF